MCPSMSLILESRGQQMCNPFVELLGEDWVESREMLGIMGQLRYNGLDHSTCHSNPEKLPYACQTSARLVQR